MFLCDYIKYDINFRGQFSFPRHFRCILSVKWGKIYHIWYIWGDFWGVLTVKVYTLWGEMGL